VSDALAVPGVLTLAIDFSTIETHLNVPSMTESEIRARLTTRILGKKLYVFDSVDSTNARAKTLALEGAGEGTLVITEDQSAGRGRQGRRWFSEKGKNLTFSIILAPAIPPTRLGVLSLSAGLAVAEAIQSTTGLPTECKWPNDVLLNSRKVSGILSETVVRGGTILALVVGIGINVNQSSFSKELNDSATSLSLAAGSTIDRLQLLSYVLGRLEFWYEKMLSQEYETILKEWSGFCRIIGRTISVDHQGIQLSGLARGIAADGALLFQTNGKEMKLSAGDVTILQN
jgi:BirA family biotin operon repressor/biotin-[acetyl-CoA-carboxylase] ligase